MEGVEWVMVNTAICILTNLFRVYLIYRYIKIFAGEDGEQGDLAHNGTYLLGISRVEFLRRMFFVIFFLVNTGCYLIFHSVWVNVFTNLAGITLLTILYQNSWKTVFFAACSVYCINIGCDCVAVLSFVEYEDGKEFNQLCEVVTVFFFSICELLTEKIVNDRKGAHAVGNLPLAMAFVPITAIVAIGFLVYIGYFEKGFMVVCIGFLVINFLVLYLYNTTLQLLNLCTLFPKPLFCGINNPY